MKNAMQLKAVVKKIAKEKKISAQLVLQNYMLERFLERVSVSRFKDNFILKGGFLIASMVGLDSRATMDMDATMKGFPVTEEPIQRMIEEVAPLAVPRKLDITTGDKITPREVVFQYKLMMEDRYIQVMAYNLATILAEKLETVVSRGDQNTRPRDYYDIYILRKLRADNLDMPTLRQALDATTQKRGTTETVKQYRSIMEIVKHSDVMNHQWSNYSKDFDYAAEIAFAETCDAVIQLMDELFASQPE